MVDDPGQSVWVVGMGVVSAAGDDIPQTLSHFKMSLRRPSSCLPFQSALHCPTFQVNSPLPQLPGRLNHSRTIRLMIKAIYEAINEAGIHAHALQGQRVGVCLGTTVASQLNSLPFYQSYRQTGRPDLEPVYDYFSANLASAISSCLGACGPQLTVVNACSSGTDAIGVAGDWIRSGRCDVVIAGGADELSQVPMAGFWSLGVMSECLCKPFDRDRNGLNLGEGAGAVILASDAWARQQNMPRDYELAGFGAASDAYHLTSPHPEGRGLESAIAWAMTQAHCTAEDIGLINAHGTATQENDRVEGTLIHRLFGNVPFVSTKGYTGHTLGAAGGIEAVFTLLALRHGWLPASAGFETLPTDCTAKPVTHLTQLQATYGMSLSLAFGGNNAAVLFRRVT